MDQIHLCFKFVEKWNIRSNLVRGGRSCAAVVETTKALAVGETSKVVLRPCRAMRMSGHKRGSPMEKLVAYDV